MSYRIIIIIFSIHIAPHNCYTFNSSAIVPCDFIIIILYGTAQKATESCFKLLFFTFFTASKRSTISSMCILRTNWYRGKNSFPSKPNTSLDFGFFSKNVFFVCCSVESVIRLSRIGAREMKTRRHTRADFGLSDGYFSVLSNTLL